MKKFFIIVAIICIMALFLVGCDEVETIEKNTEPIEITLENDIFDGQKYHETYNTLEKNGFTNIILKPLDDLSSDQKDKDDVVEYITIGGSQYFEIGDSFMSDIEVCIYYHNIDMLFAPCSSDELAKDEMYEYVKQQFEEAGFINVSCVPIKDLVFGLLTEDGEIEEVSINGVTEFKDFDMFPFDAEVIIKYHTFSEGNEEQSNHDKESDEETDYEDNNALTIDNNEDLKKLLTIKDENDPFIQEFFNKYKGRTIEFDGNIVYMTKHGNYDTRFDIMIGSGDYQENVQRGPNFKFENVSVYNLDLDTLYLESVLSVGVNIRVTAVVDDYNSDSTLFFLEPISVILR